MAHPAMLMRTKDKLRLARAASAGLLAGRRALGLPPTLRARRGGVTWELDLAEGIDLGVYMNRYQRVAPRVMERYLRPGGMALDIGANVGAFTLPLARRLGPAGYVVAIEPTQFAFDKLQRNVALNADLADRVLPVRAMLGAEGDAPATACYASWRLDGADQGGRHALHGGVGVSAAGAECLTLDALVGARRDIAARMGDLCFIKLDVDGAELSVLRGARELIAARRPPILMELAPYVQDETPGGLEGLLAELSALNYVMEIPETGVGAPMDAPGVRRMIPHGAGLDMLCRPGE